MGVRENIELSDSELRFFSFMQAFMMSIAVGTKGNDPKTSDFAEACVFGASLGAYNITDQELKDQFFSD